MGEGKQKRDAQAEECPFCGKQFKRLKSHLPHCKMAPMASASQGVKSPNAPSTLNLSSPLKPSASMNKKKMASTKKTKRTMLVLTEEDEHNTLSAAVLGTTRKTGETKLITAKLDKKKKSTPEQPSNVPAPQGHALFSEAVSRYSGKIEGKWLQRREQELVKMKPLTQGIQKGNKATSVTQKEIDELLQTTLKGPLKTEPTHATKRSSQGRREPKSTSPTKLALRGNTVLSDPLKTDSGNTLTKPLEEALRSAYPSTDQNALQVSERKVKVNFWENIETGMSSVSKDSQQKSGAEDYVNRLLPWQKTCVWDHINDGLLNRKTGSTYLANLSQTMPKVTFANSKKSSVLVQTTIAAQSNLLKPQITVTKVPEIPRQSDIQTTMHISAEKNLGLRTPGIAGIGWALERATGHRLAIPHTERSLSEHTWTKPEFTRPPPKILDALNERQLGDVKLNELIEWLTNRIPSSPREGIALLDQGVQWYYRKYIDVRKGGIGGISMLVAGYCVLSYIWSYPHLKTERWRKYH